MQSPADIGSTLAKALHSCEVKDEIRWKGISAAKFEKSGDAPAKKRK